MMYLRHKGVVLLQGLQEDGPEPGLHHYKGMLNDGSIPNTLETTLYDAPLSSQERNTKIF